MKYEIFIKKVINFMSSRNIIINPDMSVKCIEYIGSNDLVYQITEEDLKLPISFICKKIDIALKKYHRGIYEMTKY
jgi:D-ribose pyranose/furanose isomerase RbsD